MTCPYLSYRRADDDHRFATERAFCTVIDEFVQPMRADICNDRHELVHDTHCEIYREHEGLEADRFGEEEPDTEPDGGVTTDGGVAQGGASGGVDSGGGDS